MNTSTCVDERRYDLEITTRSMEETLSPLVNQITTLVNYKERPIKSEKTRQVMAQLSRALQAAIERFVAVGEKIALDHSDIKYEMFDACVVVRQAGAEICRQSDGEDLIHDVESSQTQGRLRDVRTSGGRPLSASVAVTALSSGSNGRQRSSSASVTVSGRQLLSAICRVLLLADRVVVKQLIVAIDKVSTSLSRLDRCASNADFGREFATFGDAMVNLGYLSGDRQNDLKDDVRRVQMSAARSVLEKSTTILLAACKTYLRLPDSDAARKARDCVLAHMRAALGRLETAVIQSNAAAVAVTSCASNGTSAAIERERENASALGSGDSGIVLQHAATSTSGSTITGYSNGSSSKCAFKATRELEKSLELLGELFALQGGGVLHFEDLASRSAELMQKSRVQCDAVQDALSDLAECPHIASSRRSELQTAVGRLCELVDSAEAAARAPVDYLRAVGATRMMNVLDVAVGDDELAESAHRADIACAAAVAQLRDSMRIAADCVIEMACDSLQIDKNTQNVLAVKLCAANGDTSQLADFLARFDERIDRLGAIGRPLRHVAAHEVLLAAIEHTFGTLRTLARLVSIAADTLVRHTTVRQARELLDAVCDAYQQQLSDVVILIKDIGDAQHSRWSLDTARLPVLRQLTRTQSVLSLQRAASSRAPTPCLGAPTNANANANGNSNASITNGSGAGSRGAPFSHLSDNERPFADGNRSVTSTVAARTANSRPALQGKTNLHDLGDRNASSAVTPQILIRSGVTQNVQLLSKARILDELSQPAIQFVASRGPLRTTHELFVQCARFCDELTQFNRVLRASLASLSPQLAALPLPLGKTNANSAQDADEHNETQSQHFQTLLCETDRLSTLCQQLASTVCVQTSGRAQTFQKVDSLVQLVRSVMHTVRSKILDLDGSGSVMSTSMEHRTSAGNLVQNDAMSSYSDGAPLRSVSSSQRTPSHQQYGSLSGTDSLTADAYRSSAHVSRNRSVVPGHVVSDDEVAYGSRCDDYSAHPRINLRATAGRPQPTASAAQYLSSSAYAGTGSGAYQSRHGATTNPRVTTGQYASVTGANSWQHSVQNQSFRNTQRHRGLPSGRTVSQDQEYVGNGNVNPRPTMRSLARARSEEQSNTDSEVMQFQARQSQNSAAGRISGDEASHYATVGLGATKRTSPTSRIAQIDRT